ncbi:helix-turn-helix transcriptional regulator [Rhodanobacter sp. 7MK24]|uniref:helix-turn-helix domain-containing protein n=1 Tax=Rhodanobacter sp. 7MK24 TaxID=2775922 RepID=UPI00177D72A7|nr:helix-turn-helix transcriptional regulator [Rhodanobacter sp. 7MK24]MBD8880108.1 helix-turn-helix transcriptional regulator [Rhodanobacter sp. 7MK24]
MINRALRLAREFNRMKQVELAKRLNISTSYLSEIEAGKKPPSIELLDGYAEVFGVPASTFLMFREQVIGKEDVKQQERARKLLQFFEWVAREDDDSAEKEEAAPTGNPKEAIRTH